MTNTEIITCPICGKQHSVTCATGAKNMYLDMVSMQNMVDFLNAHVVCDCGMMCFNRAHQLPTPEKLLALPRYQEVLAQYQDPDELRLAIMTYGIQYQWAPIYASHYYAQIGDLEKRKKWLSIALQRAQNGYDYSAQTADVVNFYALKRKRKFFDTQFLYTLQHKYIELYRQLGKFEEANQHCEDLLRKSTSQQEKQFLEYEKHLILAGNSNIQ